MILLVAAFLVGMGGNYSFSTLENPNTLCAEIKKRNTDSDQSFAKLLSLANRNKGDSKALWEALQKSNYILSTDAPDSSFHFEFYQYAPVPKLTNGADVKLFFRCLLESQKSHHAALTFAGHTVSAGDYLCDDGIFSFKKENDYASKPAERWGYIFDQKHLSNIYDPDYAPEGYTGFIRYDFLSLINGIMSGEIPQVNWDEVTNTLILNKSNGTSIRIRFRSPDDAIRYGAVLGEVRAQGSKKSIWCFRSFQTKHSNTIRLPQVSVESIEKQLSVGFRKVNKPNFENQSKPEILWYATTAFHPFGNNVNFSAIKNYKDLNTRERLVYLNSSCLEPLEMSRSLPVEEIDDNTLKLIVLQILQMTTWIADHSLNEGVYPDDPSMKWRELEAAFGPDDTTILFYHSIKYILYNEMAPLTLKIQYLDALGDLGHPPFFDNENAWAIEERLKDKIFYQAILWSRWQWPCEKNHIDKCIEVIETSAPSSEAERIAVETMIRLNQLPQVPAAVMKRWFRDQIGFSDPTERRINLSLLSFHPTCRNYLLKRLKDKTDTLKVQTEIANVLQLRAQAVLKTNRFDFMDEKSCSEILDATSELLKTEK
jgi:hypothetical protein